MVDLKMRRECRNQNLQACLVLPSLKGANLDTMVAVVLVVLVN